MIVKDFPLLKKVNSRGKTQLWRIWVEESSGEVFYGVQYGQEDGEMQTTYVRVDEGKNIGKKNETTAKEQAILEAESKWRKQTDKAYSTEALVSNKKLLPMLAKSFKDEKDKVVYPCLAQAKLDGLRILAHFKDGKVVLNSRKGKTYDVNPHINEALQKVLEKNPSVVLDGEGFRKDITFQKITSLVKRDEAKAGSETLQYHVYDLFDTANMELTFEERYALLEKLVKEINSPHVILVKNKEINSADEVMKAHKEFTDEGFEGAILRNKKGKYINDKRSSDLLKVKVFLDQEFKIVGLEEGNGKFEGMGIFQFETDKGAPFAAMPQGSELERKSMWTNRSTYIGKMMTVRFFEWSTSNPPVPRFPVALGIIREYE